MGGALQKLPKSILGSFSRKNRGLDRGLDRGSDRGSNRGSDRGLDTIPHPPEGGAWKSSQAKIEVRIGVRIYGSVCCKLSLVTKVSLFLTKIAEDAAYGPTGGEGGVWWAWRGRGGRQLDVAPYPHPYWNPYWARGGIHESRRTPIQTPTRALEKLRDFGSFPRGFGCFQGGGIQTPIRTPMIGVRIGVRIGVWIGGDSHPLEGGRPGKAPGFWAPLK